MSTIADHYETLYEQLQREVGAFGNETASGIIGFSEGGPVSIASVPGEAIYVTCELSLYPRGIPATLEHAFAERDRG